MLRSFYVFDLQFPLRKDLSETCHFTTENGTKSSEKPGLHPCRSQVASPWFD